MINYQMKKRRRDTTPTKSTLVNDINSIAESTLKWCERPLTSEIHNTKTIILFGEVEFQRKIYIIQLIHWELLLFVQQNINSSSPGIFDIYIYISWPIWFWRIFINISVFFIDLDYQCVLLIGYNNCWETVQTALHRQTVTHTHTHIHNILKLGPATYKIKKTAGP